MGVAGARHGDAVALVLKPVAGLVLDRCAGWLLPKIRRETAALDHEAIDDAMKQRVVEVARAHIVDEVGDGLGRAFGIELERNLTVVGVQYDHGSRPLRSYDK